MLGLPRSDCPPYDMHALKPTRTCGHRHAENRHARGSASNDRPSRSSTSSKAPSLCGAPNSEISAEPQLTKVPDVAESQLYERRGGVYSIGCWMSYRIDAKLSFQSPIILAWIAAPDRGCSVAMVREITIISRRRIVGQPIRPGRCDLRPPLHWAMVRVIQHLVAGKHLHYENTPGTTRSYPLRSGQ